MLYKKLLLPTAFLLIIFSACCIGTRECLPLYVHDADLRIVSVSDGRDLVFGQNSIYDKGKIKFYSIKGRDTTFFEYKLKKVDRDGYDSVITVDFFSCS